MSRKLNRSTRSRFVRKGMKVRRKNIRKTMRRKTMRRKNRKTMRRKNRKTMRKKNIRRKTIQSGGDINNILIGCPEGGIRIKATNFQYVYYMTITIEVTDGTPWELGDPMRKVACFEVKWDDLKKMAGAVGKAEALADVRDKSRDRERSLSRKRFEEARGQGAFVHVKPAVIKTLLPTDVSETYRMTQAGAKDEAALRGQLLRRWLGDLQLQINTGSLSPASLVVINEFIKKAQAYSWTSTDEWAQAWQGLHTGESPEARAKWTSFETERKKDLRPPGLMVSF